MERNLDHKVIIDDLLRNLEDPKIPGENIMFRSRQESICRQKSKGLSLNLILIAKLFCICHFQMVPKCMYFFKKWEKDT